MWDTKCGENTLLLTDTLSLSMEILMSARSSAGLALRQAATEAALFQRRERNLALIRALENQGKETTGFLNVKDFLRLRFLSRIPHLTFVPSVYKDFR